MGHGAKQVIARQSGDAAVAVTPKVNKPTSHHWNTTGIGRENWSSCRDGTRNPVIQLERQDAVRILGIDPAKDSANRVTEFLRRTRHQRLLSTRTRRTSAFPASAGHLSRAIDSSSHSNALAPRQGVRPQIGRLARREKSTTKVLTATLMLTSHGATPTGLRSQTATPTSTPSSTSKTRRLSSEGRLRYRC